MLATIHVHILHHTLDPFGIVLAALALLAVVSIIAVAASMLIRRNSDDAPPAVADTQLDQPRGQDAPN